LISSPWALTAMVSVMVAERSVSSTIAASKDRSPPGPSREPQGRSAGSRPRGRAGSRPSGERDVGNRAVGLVLQLEILGLGEAEAPGHEVGGEGFHRDVEIAHRAIVVAARELDLVLDGLE